MSGINSVGIVGAGKLGIVLAQLSLRAGYTVYISGSGSPDKIALSVETLAPGARTGWTADVVMHADIVVLAIPLKNFRGLDSEVFRDKLVIDAMNYWWETDGPIEDILPAGSSQSEAVQAHFMHSSVVKGLNHMGYHHLLDAVDLAPELGRKAIAIAGDDMMGVERVEQFVESLGFDVLLLGGLAQGKKLEAGKPVFGAHVALAELKQLTGMI